MVAWSFGLKVFVCIACNAAAYTKRARGDLNEVAMDAENDFSWWEDAQAGRRQPIDVNSPQAGFYRVRHKQHMVPIAYWYRDGALRCHLDGHDIPYDRAVEMWPFAAKKPVRHTDYRTYMLTGKWLGENDTLLTHNQAPPDDSVTAISDRIEDLVREAARLMTGGAAANDDAADQASDVANTLGELEAKCSYLHDIEKEPHLSAGRDCDRKWFPLRNKAAEFKTQLKRIVVTPWLLKKREAAETALNAGVAKGLSPDDIATPRTTAGMIKRSTALRTTRRAEIVDRNMLIVALKDHADLIATLQDIADAAAKKRIALPGCRLIEEQVAA